MKRRTFDLLVAMGGLLLAVTLIASGDTKLAGIAAIAAFIAAAATSLTASRPSAQERRTGPVRMTTTTRNGSSPGHRLP